jgi:putative hydrolase of the HAD superfamily
VPEVGAGRYDAVLFDFFGTLVHYSPSRTEQGYDRSHEVLRSLGCGLGYTEFLDRWSDLSRSFDARSEATGGEFSMDELVAAFLDQVVGPSCRADVDRFRDAYVSEWSTAVRPIAGLGELLGELSGRYAIAVVSNTNDLDLVPRLLDAHGLTAFIGPVVMSVGVRCRKPHPDIYRTAIDQLGVPASRCLFVGDSHAADYLGPTRFGMDALLIDPTATADVPKDHRLTSVLDLTARLLRP